MTSEQWVIWEPLADILGVVYLNILSDADQEFKVGLTVAGDGNRRQQLQLLFKRTVLFYQYSDETTRLLTLGSLEEIRPVFKVVNSTLINSLSNDAGECKFLADAVHFSILEIDSMIDIVATCEPQIIWI